MAHSRVPQWRRLRVEKRNLSEVFPRFSTEHGRGFPRECSRALFAAFFIRTHTFSSFFSRAGVELTPARCVRLPFCEECPVSYWCRDTGATARTFVIAQKKRPILKSRGKSAGKLTLWSRSTLRPTSYRVTKLKACGTFEFFLYGKPIYFFTKN